MQVNLVWKSSQEKPKIYFKNNVLGTKFLVKACVQNNVKNLLFSSTCAVYGNKKRFLIKENSTTTPLSIYGKTKLQAENIIKKNFNGNYGILRYFNVAGASSDNKFGQINKSDQLFKNLSLEVLKEKPRINIYGKNYNTKDGTCLRDYIHVEDIAYIHFQILNYISNNNVSEVFNCGYGRPYSVLEIVKAFKKLSKKNIKIFFKKRRKADIEKIYADNKKILKLISYKFKFNNLNKIINSSIKWEKKQMHN